ncbi:MAG: hypothetical protein Q8R00_04375 [Candidatus Nanoarchaeia archaeon]|nr:hypothetical protein [Candidatus Nanoarchaeia archaeon]
MTDINLIYGDEEYDYQFLEAIKRNGTPLQLLFKENPESAARYFVDIANTLDEITDRELYYRNIGKLCLDLALKEGFYEALSKIVRGSEISDRAALILYNL